MRRPATRRRTAGGRRACRRCRRAVVARRRGGGATTVGSSSTTIRRIGGGVTAFHAARSSRRAIRSTTKFSTTTIRAARTPPRRPSRARCPRPRASCCRRSWSASPVPRSVSSGSTPPAPWSWSEAPSRITTIAVSPAMRPMPSAVPVAMPGPRGRQQHAADRRRLGLAERVGRLAHVARDRLQRLARRADDQRQRDQRHHRPGGEERAAEHGAALGRERQEAEQLLREDDQAEDREHDAGRAGHDLDAGLDRPRQPERAAVLAQPDRGRDAERRGDRRAEDGEEERADQRVEEAARLALVEARPAGG